MNILPFRKEGAYFSMALDEALIRARIRGDIDDTLRFFQFDPSAISIGYFQNLESQVNLDFCKKSGIELVRRITGGGSVYHDNEGEITYSIVMKLDDRTRDISSSFEFICQGVIETLKLLEIESRFSPINDVLVGKKKISGSAQTRKNDCLLQHGTLMYKTDIETLMKALKVSKEKLSDKFIQSVKKRVTTIEEEIGNVTSTEVLEAMTTGFSNVLGTLTRTRPLDSVLDEAERLSREKYGSYSYLHLR